MEKNISNKLGKLLSVLRKNSVKIGVLACVLCVSMMNVSITEGKKESSILFGQFLGLGGSSSEIVEKGINLPNINYSASLVGINMPKMAGIGVNAPATEESVESQDAVFNSTAVLVTQNPLTTITCSDNKRNSVTIYEVQKGDTASTIAAKYGISTNTLLWANNLTERSYIRPGDELDILPVTGILHTIKSGETVSGLAKKYNADEDRIVVYNSLTADASVKIGQKIVVPDGAMPVVRASVTNSYSYSSSGGSYSYSGSAVKGPNGEKPHIFPWGQCTWYVSTQRYVPWGGHAKSWLVNAAAYGYKTGSTPIVGSIVVMREGNWLSRLWGHVAYVEAVSKTTITISEANHVGLGKKSVRVLRKDYSAIKGYIY